AQAAQKRESVQGGKGEVKQDQVWLKDGCQVDGLCAVTHGLYLEPASFQLRQEGCTHLRLILNAEDTDLFVCNGHRLSYHASFFTVLVTGRVNAKVAPWPGLLSSLRVLPCASTMPRLIYRPNPVAGLQ